MGENLCAAFLPELARPEALGKVSGWGWSLGYFGGILALGISLAWVMTAESRGSTTGEAVGGTMIITAAVFALAAAPTFLWLRERATPAADARHARRIRAAASRPRAKRAAIATCCSSSRAASSTRRAWRP